MKNPSTTAVILNRTIVQELMRIPVLVAALGYMVDMYDLFSF